jgi:2',3'-cyclic-nucleotide 2'-phosphodiesterase (5'-nucleotidase family)
MALMIRVFLLVLLVLVAFVCGSSAVQSSPYEDASGDCLKVNTSDANARTVLLFQLSDVHGWVDAHPRAPEMDVTLADFAALLNDCSQNAQVDVIATDSGDQVEGTGFSDATDPNGLVIWQAYLSLEAMTSWTVGNHDVFSTKAGVWLHEFLNDPANAEKYNIGDRYVTTNMWMAPQDASAPAEVFGTSRFRVVKLPRSGLAMLVLGFMYNFDNIDKDAFILKSAGDVVLNDDELWEDVQASMKSQGVDRIDFIMVTCHIASNDPVLSTVVTGLRAKPEFADAPIYVASGHTHAWRQMNCSDSDGNVIPQCVIVEPGRYFEKMSYVQFDFERAAEGSPWQFSTLPMPQHAADPVPATREWFGSLAGMADIHDQVSQDKVASEIEAFIDKEKKALRLDEVAGCLPGRLAAKGWYTDEDSLSNFWTNVVYPKMVLVPPHFKNPEKVVSVYNTLDCRYDLFEGENTRNDLYTSFPFNITFWEFNIIKNVTAEQVYSAINNKRPVNRPFPDPVKGYNPHYVTQYASLNDLDPADEPYTLLSVNYNTDRFVRTLNQYFAGQAEGGGDWAAEGLPVDPTDSDSPNLRMISSLFDYFKEHAPCS